MSAVARLWATRAVWGGEGLGELVVEGVDLLGGEGRPGEEAALAVGVLASRGDDDLGLLGEGDVAEGADSGFTASPSGEPPATAPVQRS